MSSIGVDVPGCYEQLREVCTVVGAGRIRIKVMVDQG